MYVHIVQKPHQSDHALHVMLQLFFHIVSWWSCHFGTCRTILFFCMAIWCDCAIIYLPSHQLKNILVFPGCCYQKHYCNSLTLLSGLLPHWSIIWIESWAWQLEERSFRASGRTSPISWHTDLSPSRPIPGPSVGDPNPWLPPLSQESHPLTNSTPRSGQGWHLWRLWANK